MIQLNYAIFNMYLYKLSNVGIFNQFDSNIMWYTV